MRYIPRTLRISIGKIHDWWKKGIFKLEYVKSDDMRADVFTKNIPEPAKWAKALDMLNITDDPEGFIKEAREKIRNPAEASAFRAVSYTHLTLPTICSV